jgi:hypothetical protein
MVSTECACSFNKYLFQQGISYRVQFSVSVLFNIGGVSGVYFTFVFTKFSAC